MFFRMINERSADKADVSNDLIGKMKNLVFDHSSKPFFYNIAGVNYTLDDIKHGILRGNRRKPGSIMKVLSNGDPKGKLIIDTGKLDPRINFVCHDFPTLVEHIDAFKGDTEDELD